MIRLCERCLAQIEDSEPMVRLAHLAEADNDGTTYWRHSYLHRDPCPAPTQPEPPRRPDPGDWDPRRGIGIFRL